MMMLDNKTTLKRSLSLTLVTFYGLGNILGAGIYVLVGKVAGEAGYFSPLAFFIASIIAAISAFTYAELSARYPVSAGESVYLHEAFGLKRLSQAVGLMICFAGIVSSATIAHGFAGYMQVFVDLPDWLIMSQMLVVLGALAAWGISQSVTVAAVLTILEMFGLLLIFFVGADQLPQLGHSYQQHLLDNDSVPHGFAFLGVFSGAFLAFYAYLGFEDMVKVSEETRDPRRTMPKAIILCVIISTLFYGLVSLVAISVLSPMELSASDAPLAAVYSKATGKEPFIISAIGSLAVINGALIQIIMSSRILYGMSRQGWLPESLGVVNAKTRVPLNSTVITVILIMVFAMILPMVRLAELTSYLILMVFVLVNLALIRIKQRHPAVEGITLFSLWLPKLGFVTTISFLLIKLLSNFI
jgi:APA family basic amino acid/polyamine antiporter